MPLPLTIFILLTLCAVMTSVISAVVGMAGGIVLLSVMTFFMPLKEIIPIHGMVQLISNSTRTIYLRKNIQWNLFLPAAIALPFGTALAVFLIKKIDHPQFALGLIVILIIYVVFKPKKLPNLNIPAWSFSLLGFMAGFLCLLIGATGPMLAPFFLRDDLKKEQIVATKSSIQIMTHLVKVPAFLFLDFPYMKFLPIILAMTIAAVLGTYLGVKLLGKINETAFRWLYKTALLAAAIRISYKLAIGS
jgi:uncharacterized protein